MANRKDRRKETQRQQAEARKSGLQLHPRGLARSVAKHYGHGTIDEDWEVRVARLPRTGRSRIYPKVRKVEAE